MKKVLITGGAGFIGTHLCLKLIERGYTVSVIDNLSEQIHGTDPERTSPLFNYIKGQVNFMRGNVTKRMDMVTAIADNEVIVHLAAETGTGQSMYQVQKYIDTNIVGTATLLDILINNKHCVKKVLVASSRAVYGEGKYFSKEFGVVYPEPRTLENLNKGYFEVIYPGSTSPLELMPTDETSKLHPTSVYGITKLNQEQLVMTVCRSIKIPCVGLRYQNVYGPGQSLSNPYTGILSIFSTQIKNANPVNIFEDGKESRDFVYISDVIDATILCIENKNADFEVFNVGSGRPTDVYTVAKTLLKYYKAEVPVFISGNYRIGDVRHNFADLNKIRRVLGFTPKVTFNKGIKEFTNWVNNQNIQEDKYPLAISEMQTKGLFN
jgi:dTDP-L-rhamnose 4-epimerase